jgi:hypothetical protein
MKLQIKHQFLCLVILGLVSTHPATVAAAVAATTTKFAGSAAAPKLRNLQKRSIIKGVKGKSGKDSLSRARILADVEQQNNSDRIFWDGGTAQYPEDFYQKVEALLTKSLPVKQTARKLRVLLDSYNVDVVYRHRKLFWLGLGIGDKLLEVVTEILEEANKADDEDEEDDPPEGEDDEGKEDDGEDLLEEEPYNPPDGFGGSAGAPQSPAQREKGQEMGVASGETFIGVASGRNFP